MTVSFPVRRRSVFAADRRRRLLDLRTGAPPRRRRLLFLLDRNSDLARRSQRGNLRGCRLAGPLGHLAAGFFLLAALRLLFGSLARLLFGAAARLLLFDLPARFLLGPAARLLRRRALPPAGADPLRRGPPAGGASSSALRASCTARVRPARSSAVSVRAITTGRRAGSWVAGRGAGWSRATAGVASARPASGSPG